MVRGDGQGQCNRQKWAFDSSSIILFDYQFIPSCKELLEKTFRSVQHHVRIVTVSDWFWSTFQVESPNTLFWKRIYPTEITWNYLFLKSQYGVKSKILSPRSLFEPFCWLSLCNHWFICQLTYPNIPLYLNLFNKKSPFSPTKSPHLVQLMVTLFLKGSYETPPFSSQKKWFQDIFPFSWSYSPRFNSYLLW